MKLKNLKRVGQRAIGGALVMIALAACKKGGESSGDPRDSGGGSGQSGAAEAVAPVPVGKDVGEQLIGYWAPDKATLTGMLQDEVARSFGTEGAKKVVEPMVDAMLQFAVYQLTGDKAFMIGPRGYYERSAYKLVESDRANGTFVMEVSDKQSGEIELQKGAVTDEQLSMSVNGKPVVMRRIDELEFEARKQKVAGFDAQAMLAPIMASFARDGAADTTAPAGAPGLPPGISIPPQPSE